MPQSNSYGYMYESIEGTRVIDQRLPRYQRVRDHIAEQIAAKTLLPGEAIPTEAELAASHGVAVGTVRKAMDALLAEGLVERHQGRGTFVRRPNFKSSLFRFFRHQGRAGEQAVPESRLLKRETRATCPPQVADALQLSRQAQAIRLSRLRLAGGVPFLLEDIWLAHARFSRLLTATEAEMGPLLYPAYERICGEVVARAEETLTVGTADKAAASLLGIEPGAPVVKIDRLAFGFDGNPLEWRRTHGVAATFRYKVDIR